MITAKLLLVYLLQSTDVTGLTGSIPQIDEQEAYCLAKNIYYEARSEDIKGQFAVASVTLNRAKDGRFPDSICGVVQQKTRLTDKTVCAFSWYCESAKRDKEIPVKNKDGTINQLVMDQFKAACLIAIAVLNGTAEDNTKGATHFHNRYTSNPAWKYTLQKTMTLGNHDFYRLKASNN